MKVPEIVQRIKIILCSSISGPYDICMPIGVLTGLCQANHSTVSGNLSETRLCCLLFGVQYSLSTVQCPISTIHFPLSTVQYPLSTVHYQLSTLHCPMSTVSYPDISSLYSFLSHYLGIYSLSYGLNRILKMPIWFRFNRNRIV